LCTALLPYKKRIHSYHSAVLLLQPKTLEMKKNLYLLTVVFVFFGLVGGSCTKDNVQPDSYNKQGAGTTTNAAAVASSPSPGASVPVAPAAPESECALHGH
jgi:hypothetical protein